MKRQFGISLTEVLVALILSSFLILMVMNQYLSVKQHYQHIQKNLETALDSQIITDLIRNAVWQAGFTPCLSIDHLSTLDTRDPSHSLHSIEINADKLGHGFQVNHMSHHYNILTQQVSLTEWTSTNTVDLSRHKSVLIADCAHAEVHRLRSVRNKPDHLEISFIKPLSDSFEPPIYIGEWVEEHFFVRAGTLFYQIGSAEAISDAVTDLAVSLSQQHGRRLLKVLLSLKDNPPIVIDTAVRTV